jgi:DNA-binding CsgD family transcriptional regulator
MNLASLLSPVSLAVARELAVAFASLQTIGVVDRALYNGVLRATLERHPEFWGVWSIWEPDALDGRDRDFANQEGHDDTGRFVSLWKRAKDGPSVEPNIGYELPGLGDYYIVPRQRGREVSFEPYEYRPLDGKPRQILSQVAPIVVQGRFLGVAGFDVAVEEGTVTRSSAAPPVERMRYSGSIRRKVDNVLTGREREVLDWLSEGKSNPEIGIILGISAHTVKHHLEKIFAKLGVENRHAAMLWALRPRLTAEPLP